MTDREKWVTGISKSKYTVKNFFTINKVPFSIAQFYRYKKVNDSGKKIFDGRSQGNCRKLSALAEGFLIGLAESDRHFSLRDLKESVFDRFEISVSESTLSKFLTKNKVKIKFKCDEEGYGVVSTFSHCAGLEIIIALAYQTGWLESIADVIETKIDEIKSSDCWKCTLIDRKGRNKRDTLQKNIIQEKM